MSRYRLRVELPDLPGALAKVATVISDLDGDVVSIDIHELDGHQVVDELVVEVLTELDGRVLGAALEQAGAGILLSCSPAAARPEPVVEALAWARGAGGGQRHRHRRADPRGRVSLVEGLGRADRRGERGARRAPRPGSRGTARAAVARPARAARWPSRVDDVAAGRPRRTAADALHRVPGPVRFAAVHRVRGGAGQRARWPCTARWPTAPPGASTRPPSRSQSSGWSNIASKTSPQRVVSPSRV